MNTPLNAALLVVAAAVTLASVATASPQAVKQRVQITYGGVASSASVGKFVLTPLSAGPLQPDRALKTPTSPTSAP